MIVTGMLALGCVYAAYRLSLWRIRLQGSDGSALSASRQRATGTREEAVEAIARAYPLVDAEPVLEKPDDACRSATSE